MGEIRSTLDIIMEKTKGLTLSEEERLKVREKELQGKVKGILQKLLDGLMQPGQAQEELAGLGEKAARAMLISEALAQLDPVQDPTAVLEILEQVAGVDPKPVGAAVAAAQQGLAEERVQREDELLVSLRRQGISGSAVLPNPEADPGWKERLGELKERLQQDLGRRRLTAA